MNKKGFLKYKKNNLGFTLVELLVSIFIIAIISGIFLANYNFAEKSSGLSMAAQKLVSDIRQAQNFALGLKEFKSNKPKGGWGVYFRKNDNKYIIFADVNENGLYDTSELFKEIYFSRNLRIVDFDPHNGSVNDAQIVFIPPDPDIEINYSVGFNDEITIILSTLESGSTNSIGVLLNIFGLIDVEK